MCVCEAEGRGSGGVGGGGGSGRGSMAAVPCSHLPLKAPWSQIPGESDVGKNILSTVESRLLDTRPRVYKTFFMLN